MTPGRSHRQDEQPSPPTWPSGYCAREKLRAVRPNTIDGCRVDQKHVAAAIGKVRLDRLSPGNVEHLWAYLLDRGLTVGHCRRTLNAALNDAVKRGLIARNPAKAAEMVGESQDEIVPYTLDQMTALLRAAKGSRNAARWRVSEPKSDAGKRTLSLPVPVTDELRAHRKAQLAERVASEIWEQGPDGGWVFANGRGGPTYPRADGRDFKALCGQAKVPAQAAP